MFPVTHTFQELLGRNFSCSNSLFSASKLSIPWTSLQIPILKVLLPSRNLWRMSPRKGNDRLRNNPHPTGDFTFRAGHYSKWKMWIFISSMVFFLWWIWNSQYPAQPGNSRSCWVLSSLDSPKRWIPQGNHCFAWKNIFILQGVFWGLFLCFFCLFICLVGWFFRVGIKSLRDFVFGYINTI